MVGKIHNGSDSEDDIDIRPYTRGQPRNNRKDQGSSKVAGSIVHLDIVKRNKSAMSSSNRPTTAANTTRPGTSHPSASLFEDQHSSDSEAEDRNRGDGDNDDDDDCRLSVSSDEDIGITHSERMKMAAASSTSSSLFKARQTVLQKLQAKHTPQSAIQEDSEPNKSYNAREERDQANTRRKSVDELASPRANFAINSEVDSKATVGSAATVKSMSSQAGFSLGFNLAGSLAAIDQWVQDMSSSSEDEDGSGSKHKPKNTDSSEIPVGIAALTTAVGQAPNGDTPLVTPRSSNNNSSKNLKDKILSRDAIFNMVSFNLFI
jgi:hypothetical protein